MRVLLLEQDGGGNNGSGANSYSGLTFNVREHTTPKIRKSQYYQLLLYGRLYASTGVYPLYAGGGSAPEVLEPRRAQRRARGAASLPAPVP
jgi:hypothetical protein